MDTPPPPPPLSAPPPPPPPPPAQWSPGGPPPQVPWTPMPQSPPPKKPFRGQVVRIGIGFGILAVILIAIFLFRDRLTGNVTQLQVGDCIDVPTANVSVTDVQHHPCTEPHDAEVYLLFNDPAGSGESYPILETHFRELAGAHCLPAASTYLGTDFNLRTDLDAGYFYPTSDGWTAKNDRGITCYFYRVDKGKLAAPLRATGPSSSP